MNQIASFRLCTLSDSELLQKVDEATDSLYTTGKIPMRHIPARPDEDYDLLVGELISRYKERLDAAQRPTVAPSPTKEIIPASLCPECNPEWRCMILHRQAADILECEHCGRGLERVVWKYYHKNGGKPPMLKLTPEQATPVAEGSGDELTAGEKRWPSTEAFVATGEAVYAIETSIGVATWSLADINGLQDLLIKNGFAIQPLSYTKDVARLKQWVSDLQSGMYINCVYCGHRYGKEGEVAESMADVLKRHVEQCPEHPMSHLKQQVAALQAENAELRRRMTGC